MNVVNAMKMTWTWRIFHWLHPVWISQLTRKLVIVSRIIELSINWTVLRQRIIILPFTQQESKDNLLFLIILYTELHMRQDSYLNISSIFHNIIYRGVGQLFSVSFELYLMNEHNFEALTFRLLSMTCDYFYITMYHNYQKIFFAVDITWKYRRISGF